MIRGMVRSLVDHGFQRFLVINGHGGNTASLNAAFSEIYGEVRRGGGNAPDVRCKVLKWFQNPQSEALSLELTGHPAGGHASAAEVSVAQFADPANIKKPTKMEPDFASNDHTFYNADDFRRRFADGRIESNPTGSTPEIGRQLVETAALFFAETYREFLADT